MAKKTILVNVTYIYTIEVDTENAVVKEYKTEKEMLEDLVHYNFKVLPVLEEGVKITDISVDDWISLTKPAY